MSYCLESGIFVCLQNMGYLTQKMQVSSFVFVFRATIEIRNTCGVNKLCDSFQTKFILCILELIL